MKKFAVAMLGCAALFSTVGEASAVIIQKAIQIRRPGTSGSFLPLNYVDENGVSTPLGAGSEIISTTIHLDYTPSNADELAAFDYILTLPVDSLNNTIHLATADLTPISPTAYGYDIVTDAFNGEMIYTSFGYQLLGRGTYSSDSFVTMTISAVPEPTGLAIGLPLLGFLARRRRA